MPDVGATIVRGHLQTASVEWSNPINIADEVFPRVTLATTKTKITKYNRGDQFRDEAQVRARGSETNVMDWSTSEVNVDTVQHAAKHMVTKEDMRDAGLKGVETPPLRLREKAIMRNAAKLDIKHERLIETLVTDGTWVDGAAGGEDTDAKWVASTGNTFIVDIDKAVRTMTANGVPPVGLRLLMDARTGIEVKRISDLTAVLSYTGAKARGASSLLITEQMIADLLGLDKVIIAQSIYSTAIEKADGTDFTSAYIWDGDNAKGFGFVYSFPPSGVLGIDGMAPGVCAYNKMENGATRATYEWYNKDRHAHMYETQEEVGGVQVAAQAGYLFCDTHTT